MRVLILLAVVTTTWAAPRPQNPMENPHLYEGDIIGAEGIEDGKAIPHDTRSWPGGIIPYKMDKGLDDLKDEIAKAMKYIMDRTCVKFVPWDGLEKAYIKIFRGDGCYSYWGRKGKIQPLSLGYGCEPIGTILHELMHAIGFDHEQNRFDRDNFLLIFWQNIWPDALYEFEKQNTRENPLINKFDYNSIMLYGEKAFSKDGWSKTMKSKWQGIKMRDVIQKAKLSDSDVFRVNTMYKCDKKE